MGELMQKTLERNNVVDDNDDRHPKNLTFDRFDGKFSGSLLAWCNYW